MKTVKITAQPAFLSNGQANPNAGKIFTPNPQVSAKDGKLYGYYRVESVTIVQDGPIDRVEVRSALRSILAEDFKKVEDQLVAGKTMNGQIIHVDSTTPAYEGQDNLKAPVRGEDGKNVLDKDGNPVLRDVTSGGMKVYRRTIFTPNQDSFDAKLIYDQVSTATAAPAAAKTAETVLAN